MHQGTKENKTAYQDLGCLKCFLLNKVSFESDASKKDPCITREHNLQAYMTKSMIKGLHYIIQRFQTRSAIWKVSEVRQSLPVKQKGGLTSFLVLNVLETQIFQCDFLEGRNV